MSYTVVGTRKSIDTLSTFMYDRRNTVAKASINDVLMSHCLLK